MSEQQHMNQAAFARYMGVSAARISKLKSDGRLVMVGNMVDVQASAAKIRVARVASMRADESSGDDAERSTSTVGIDWRDRKERAQAQLAEIDVAHRAGLLLRADEVRSVVADAVTAIRSRLELLPEQVAPSLAAETDEHRIRLALAADIESALTDLSDSLRTLLGTARGGAH